MHSTRRQTLAAVGTLLVGAGCLGGSDDTRATVGSLPAPTLGDPDTPVVVAGYTDYACPHCHRWALEAFPPIREEYVRAGRARYEHHDFPVPVDERWSWDVAAAGRAVQDRQGDAAYFEFSRRAYRRRGEFTEETVRRLADAAGADGEAVLADVRDDVYRPAVESDREAGIDRGVRGTPAVFVAGTRVEPSTSAVAAAIEDAE